MTTDHRSFWDDYVASHTPEQIAKRLLHDKQLIQEGHPPSNLALHLPKTSSEEAADIGSFLAPPAHDFHPSVARLLYRSARDQITRAIHEPQTLAKPKPEDGYQLAADLPSFPTGGPKDPIDSAQDELNPTDADVSVALKVLRFLREKNGRSLSAFDEVISQLNAHFHAFLTHASNGSQPAIEKIEEPPVKTQPRPESWDDHVDAYHAVRPPFKQRRCYICHFGLSRSHKVYSSLCISCGDFNMAGLRLSSPESLKLAGRTALVTGARVNLGYHTALRLLRCGAQVIASTRYPNDAAIRYSNESDFDAWKDSLKIVGADFRTARDAFALVEATRSALSDWGRSTLDILVNNAAQTLTDSVRKEQRAVFHEQQYLEQASSTGLLLLRMEGKTPYQPRIRGGVSPLALYGAPDRKAIGFGEEPEKTLVIPDGVKDDGRTELEPYFKSSWVQSISDIPYEDVISAHAVNTFVPLILCRELLPCMGSAAAEREDATAKKPLGYIINVSSREGIFEINPAHRAKNGMHVHTNMSKAALNMITQTEASGAWKSHRVAMNSVDPGYMSAAPEMDGLFGGTRPIGWEDGTARVLWPVAIGEVEGKGVWGRFLKHFGAVDVDSSLSR